MNKKNILVTGCAGFIASHLIEDLLKNTQNIVIGIDNFYSGTQKNIDFLKSLASPDQFIFYQDDIRNFETLNKIMALHKIEYVFHLAAIVSVQESLHNTPFTSQVNIQGTINLLEASKNNQIKKIVFSSSAAVYGDEPSLPKTETSPTKPISPYGLDKLIAEQYMKLYSDLYGISMVVLRYFNVYGPRQLATSDYSGVISIFNDKLSKGESPTIYGDGNQYRDFIYVKDVAKANIASMDIKNSYEIICIGSAVKTSINDIFNLLKICHKQSTKANYAKARVGDINESISNNKKMKTLLNFTNFYMLKDTLCLAQ